MHGHPPSDAPAEKRLFLAFLLAQNGLFQWEPVDMTAAEALAEGLDTPAIAQLASLSQPLDTATLRELLSRLAEEREWLQPGASESLLYVAEYCAEDAINATTDPIEACKFIYEYCYLRLESQGDDSSAEILQPFVGVAISWDENIDSSPRTRGKEGLRESLRREALGLFADYLAHRHSGR